ncbi:deoxyribose-phosphate aldolase [Paenibacillus whitsoniae]|uniref:Deoxyribose-phosphate aldolase n=1 Tax=Paenibacillus whitsoniae TaxID=2496558 RepID=A0A3S0AAL6_9BACL|nr:deoxyribose-phosphate aldolase [Paenibacillus whitsoniae]RTE08491.1 deoxyribose-phosphate aldolase [Paenibacillus whitsoniae]
MKLSAKEIASYIDHTLLKADASTEAILKLCAEAAEHQFFSVCVNSQFVETAAKALEGTGVKVAAVVGFPLGASLSEVKAFEAAEAVESGASEIDTVLPIGLLMEGNYDAVRSDIQQVVEAVKDQAIVKVIMETGFLTEEQKVKACRLSEEAGAHFVKTSTGFGPGGATVEDVRLMRQNVSSHIGVKASGGVRDLQTAIAMIEAGATRLGTSSGVAIVNGTQGASTY